ncbi:hypothetical protein [Nocardia inohanensis]|uniref:hypothetical protein n=1 Tax=Nocardia inohanensis TaxID=209246 RepID=UPI00082E46DE|nr:hypothetical protein [Nocardia inohanensis]
MAQRIVRAKRTIAAERVPFEVPAGPELAARLGSVLEVIAAVHALAPTAADTDWRRIAGLYAALSQRFPSPIVELNRAVAVSKLHGPAAGLELADKVSGELDGYHLLRERAYRAAGPGSGAPRA